MSQIVFFLEDMTLSEWFLLYFKLGFFNIVVALLVGTTWRRPYLVYNPFFEKMTLVGFFFFAPLGTVVLFKCFYDEEREKFLTFRFLHEAKKTSPLLSPPQNNSDSPVCYEHQNP
jgi:hypothetical protein